MSVDNVIIAFSAVVDLWLHVVTAAALLYHYKLVCIKFLFASCYACLGSNIDIRLFMSSDAIYSPSLLMLSMLYPKAKRKRMNSIQHGGFGWAVFSYYFWSSGW